jgi:hypothetical protein
MKQHCPHSAPHRSAMAAELPPGSNLTVAEFVVKEATLVAALSSENPENCNYGVMIDDFGENRDSYLLTVEPSPGGTYNSVVIKLHEDVSAANDLIYAGPTSIENIPWWEYIQISEGQDLLASAIPEIELGENFNKVLILNNVRDTQWDLDTPYYMSAAAPAILMLSLLLLQLFIVPVCLCRVRRISRAAREDVANDLQTRKGKRVIYASLFMSVALAVSCIMVTTTGGLQFTNAVNEALIGTCRATSLLGFAIFWTSFAESILNQTAESLLLVGSALSDCDSVNVPTVSPDRAYEIIENAKENMRSIVVDLTSELKDFRDISVNFSERLLDVNGYMDDVFDSLVGVLIISFAILYILTLTATFRPKWIGLHSRCGRKVWNFVTSPAGYLLLIVLWLLTALAYYAAAFSGDFCRSPTANVGEIFTESDVAAYVNYYTTCEGPPPPSLEQFMSIKENYITGVKVLGPLLSLADEADLSLCVDASEAINSAQLLLFQTWLTFVATTALTSCSTINEVYRQVVYTSLCGDFNQAILLVRIGFLLGAIFLSATVLLWGLLSAWGWLDTPRSRSNLTESHIDQVTPKPSAPPHMSPVH